MWFFRKKKPEENNKERFMTEFPLGKVSIVENERYFVDTSKCEILFAYSGTHLKEILFISQFGIVLNWVVKTSNGHFVILKKYVDSGVIIAYSLGGEDAVEDLYFKVRGRLFIDNFKKTQREI